MRGVGRPRLYDTERLLDAAVALAAGEGPAAVTMAGLARSTGAPSGSLYHRFGARAALLGAVWLRTVTRFQAGFLSALGRDPPAHACMAAARHVVTYSREHPADARILLRGPEELGSAAWPPAVRARVDAAQGELETALRDAAGRLGGADRLAQVVLVAVDLPYAVVRRHLRTGGGGIPARAEDLVEQAARAILRGA